MVRWVLDPGSGCPISSVLRLGISGIVGFSSIDAGGWGLIVAGICYIVPSMMTVLGLAWAYVRFGSLPALEGILFGIKPVVIAILIAGSWDILKPRPRNPDGLIIAVIVCGAYLAGLNPIVLLLAGGTALSLYRYIQGSETFRGLVLLALTIPAQFVGSASQPVSFNLLRLFWLLLKAGAMMLGSEYALLAFIHDALVIRLGLLTNAEMIDAIAVGQVTPGPLSTTATFVGYVMGGLPAVLLVTVAMFLPSFLFIGVIVRLVQKTQRTDRNFGIMEGVNFAALGLMAGVT